MMRQILALVLGLAFAGAVHAGSLEDEFNNLPAKPARNSARVKRSVPKHKRLDEMHTTQERWNELQSDNALQHDDEREAYRAPVRTRPAMNPRAVSNRAPASVPAALPASAPAPTQLSFASLSFEEYLKENGRNPALNRHIPDHQKAFADASAPAVISLPDSDSGSSSSSSAANPAADAGGNAAAIHAAAAAAAAAGLIPAGAVGGTASSPTSSTPGGPVR
jgi:hypothetical protein